MAMTPRLRSSGVSCSSVFSAPRSLNEAVNCRFSNLIQTSALAMRDSVSLRRQGVCTTAPAMRAAARCTSSRVTGRAVITAGQPAVDPVARAVPGADQRQEPRRIAVVERMLGETRGRRTALIGALRAAGDLLGRLGAEIGHHRHAAAVAGQQVVHALVLAHVRHGIEREGDVARPGMGDADALELREAVDHVLVAAIGALTSGGAAVKRARPPKIRRLPSGEGR